MGVDSRRQRCLLKLQLQATGTIMATISLGLSGRNLKDKDFLGKSDPYLIISRPDMGGGFTNILTSETKQNTLNPDWDDFLFKQHQLSGEDKDLKLKIEVFDDDGKKGPDGKDDIIGTGFFSLKELEAAALLQSQLPLSDGKKDKPSGHILVRSYREI